MEVKKKEPTEHINYHKMRDALRSKDETFIKINGVEVKVCEYWKDPEKYNKKQMSNKYVEEVRKHLEKSIADKERLKIDSGTIKSFIR